MLVNFYAPFISTTAGEDGIRAKIYSEMGAGFLKKLVCACLHFVV